MAKSIEPIAKKLPKLASGLLSELFILDPLNFSHKQLKYAAKHFNYEDIEDRYLADDRVLSYLHAPALSRQKIVRIIGINKNFLDYISLEDYDFRARDVKHLLVMNTDYYDFFKLGEKDQTKEDALALLTTNKEELVDKIEIQKHDFSGKQNFAIAAAHDFKRKTILQINLKTFREYHIAELLIETGVEYIDLFDTSKLSANRWAQILIENEELIDHCDFNIFKEADIYYSVELVTAYEEPDFTYLIDERDYIQELSGLGWSKLLITHPNKYIDDCNFSKLSETHWSDILDHHPNLIVYKP